MVSTKTKQTNRQLFSLFSKPLAVVARPFKSWAKSLGVKEEDVPGIIRRQMASGLVRRFGAVLDHRKIGLKENLLVAWRMDAGPLSRAVKFISGLSQVSHCYKRKTQGDWQYNLYTMIHGHTRRDCLNAVERIKAETGAGDYCLLFTEKELKKTRFRV